MTDTVKSIMKNPIAFARRYYTCHKETIDNFFWRSLQIFGKQGISFLIFLITANYLIPKKYKVIL